MQAAQLLPGSTRNAAEPTAGPNAAAVGADDTDENEDGRVCVGGLAGPCAVLLKARVDRSTSGLLLCTNCRHRVHHVQARPDDGTRLLIAARTASAHANRPRQPRPACMYLPCGALAASCS